MTSGPDGISPALSTSWAPSFLLSVSGGTGGHRGGGGARAGGPGMRCSSPPCRLPGSQRAHVGVEHGLVSSLLLFLPSSYQGGAAAGAPLAGGAQLRERRRSTGQPGRRWGRAPGGPGSGHKDALPGCHLPAPINLSSGYGGRRPVASKAERFKQSSVSLNSGRFYRKS